jgi:predicted exporter
MRLHRLATRLLAVFAIVGLVAAPLVTPAAAKPLAVAEMTDMSAMAGDMQCCPDGQKNNSCQDCPLVAVCMLTIAQAGSSPTDGVQISFQSRRLTFALVDLIGDGLIGAPPDHPPRIST